MMEFLFVEAPMAVHLRHQEDIHLLPDLLAGEYTVLRGAAELAFVHVESCSRQNLQ